MRKSKVKVWGRSFFWIFFSILAFVVIVITLFPFLFTRSWTGIDFRGYGTIGDTIGGVTAPFIASAAALLTFIAFWVQFKANEQQKIDLQIERFENKFYALLEIHRNNVAEVSIGKTTQGRKAFISMFNELKFTYYLVEEYYENAYRKTMPDDKISRDVRFNIAYLIFFFGVGPNSTPIVIDLIGEKYNGFFLCIEEYVKKHQSEWKKLRPNPIGVNTGTEVFSLDIRYKPCNGHASKLSHYVRHLFQLIKFIDDADDHLFSYEEKYEYAASVRSQLSVHEQLLLFYNAVSILGKPWFDDPELMKKYCLIKSSPLTIANFYKSPQDELGESNIQGKNIFEWKEIKERLSNL